MGVTSKNFTQSVAGERHVRFRIRNANTAGPQADTNMVSPYHGRIKRLLIATDGSFTANWVANIQTPRGTVTGAINVTPVGFANIGSNDCFQVDLPDRDEYYVHPGDSIEILTTTGNGTATSMYGWMVIQ